MNGKLNEPVTMRYTAESLTLPAHLYAVASASTAEDLAGNSRAHQRLPAFPRSAGIVQDVFSMPSQGLPRQLTSFIGREHEVRAVATRLIQPDCQLLTLLGPGGIGKTRLAIQVVNRILQDEPEVARRPIHYISLQEVASAEFLPFAIAQSLGLLLTEQDPDQQLIGSLEDAEMLLVLDNFEHLLAGATLLAELLQAAPRLKLLVTSREVLNLQGEWIYPLDGLRFPAPPSQLTLAGDPLAIEEAAAAPATPQATLQAYDATRLFVERARRVNAHFDAQHEAEAIIQLCQIVGGMPLAIELAAAWTRSLACAAIVTEIQQNLHFLASNLRDIAEGHRSMRAVFARSWRFLTPTEQHAFQRMVVFHGGFTREAAEAVAGATLPILTTLVDKSLLRVDAQGRYLLHELLRQYAREYLEESPTQAIATRDHHAHYYLHYLTQRQAGLLSAEQHQCVQEIAAEWENIRAAWLVAVDQVWIDEINTSCLALQYYCDYQGRFREQSELIQRAHDALRHTQPTGDNANTAPHPAAYVVTLAAIETLLGWCHIRVGRLAAAEAIFIQAGRRYGDLQMAPPPGFGTDPLPGQALAVTAQGRYAEAIELALRALARLEASGDRANFICAAFVVGDIYLSQGDLAQAAHYSHRTLRLAIEDGNRWMQAYVLRSLGKIALSQGHFAQAEQHYQACFDLKEALGDPEGMATALVELANVALQLGDTAKAGQLYRCSEQLYRRIYDRGGLVNALHGLASTALAQAQWVATAARLREGLEIATAAGLTPQILALALCAAQWLRALGEADHSADLLQWVMDHPATDHRVRQSAIRIHQAEPHRATTHHAPDALPQLIHRLQARLAQPLPASPVPPAPSPTLPGATMHQQANQTLIEPLTERELEVLQLLAEGCSNQEIANRLIIAVGTVKSYTSHIYGKLGVDNRTQAILHAQQIGLL